MVLLLAYTGASLFHYVHNAVLLDAAWLGVTVIGLEAVTGTLLLTAVTVLMLRRPSGLAGLEPKS